MLYSLCVHVLFYGIHNEVNFFNLSLLLTLSATAEIFEDKDLIEYSGRKYAPVAGLVVKKNESGQIVEKTFYKDGLKNGLTESFIRLANLVW